MRYPKPIMSISEMAEMGFSRTALYEFAHHQLAERYVIKTPKGGKIFFDTAEFEKLRSRLCTSIKTS